MSMYIDASRGKSNLTDVAWRADPIGRTIALVKAMDPENDGRNGGKAVRQKNVYKHDTQIIYRWFIRKHNRYMYIK